MSMFDLDDKEIRNLEKDLKTFADRAFPFATKNTLNRAGFQAQRETQFNIDQNIVQRNKFTRSSIRVEMTRSLNVRTQAVTVGSVAPYFETMEFGGVETPGGREGVAIATSFAAGQGEARPRTRLPRRQNKLASIQLQRNKRRGGNRKQRNLIAVRQAVETKQRYVFLDLGRRKGLFKVTGGKKAPRVRMVWDLSRRSVRTPATPTLAPAVRTTQRAVPTLYRSALVEQLRRQGLLGY